MHARIRILQAREVVGEVHAVTDNDNNDDIGKDVVGGERERERVFTDCAHLLTRHMFWENESWNKSITVRTGGLP